MPLPNNIQVELVQGCNRCCDFCGIHSLGKQARKPKLMPLELVTELAVGLGKWKGFDRKRVEFAMHGEPTLFHNLAMPIIAFRANLPQAQLQLTSNGIVPRKCGAGYVAQLFADGLNILILDMYSHQEETVELAKEAKAIDNTIQVYDYYRHSFNPYHYHNQHVRVIVLMRNLGAESGKRAARKILNHAGNANAKVLKHKYGVEPLRAPLQKKCSRPFREIVVHHDGTIPVCCLDWRHECIMGSFPTSGSLEEIWNGELFGAARKLLSSGNRSFVPCYRCDYNGGFRLGLLPEPWPHTKNALKKLEEVWITHNRGSGDPFHAGEYYKRRKGIRDFV